MTEGGGMGAMRELGEHYFNAEKLEVFWAAVEYASWRRGFVQRRLMRDADLRNQLTRASRSIVLNISEGSGELSPAEKAHFYRMARRSATECAGALVVAEHEHIASHEEVAPGRELLWRIVAMLSRMSISREDPAPFAKGGSP